MASADASMLRFADAKKAASAAIDRADRDGLAIAVAVCDANGRLLVFYKLDGTDVTAGHEAIGRAIAAAGSGKPSELAGRDHGRASTVAAEGPGASNRPGGLPLSRDGGTVGAIGVCGGTEQQAIACAQAGTGAV